MASVYVNNLVINAGADFTQSFTLQDPATNSNFDLTTYTVAAQMRKWAGSDSAITFDASRQLPYTSGKILLKLTSTQTISIKPGRYVYDVVITDQFGVKNRVVEGMVLVREGVTQ
jgi:hypothetical protein